MTTSTLSRRAALGWLAALAGTPIAAAAATPPAELPGNSIYQLRPPLTDQDGRPFELGSLRGQPVLVSMFYSSCEMVCPMIFETIHQTVQALPAPDRDRVRVLMVSFDPARDSVAVLKQTAQAHRCDSRWTLARTDEASAASQPRAARRDRVEVVMAGFLREVGRSESPDCWWCRPRRATTAARCASAPHSCRGRSR